MIVYFDSNVLLSILKHDEKAAMAAELWHDADFRVSSVLLEAECLTVVRRVARETKKKLPKDWLAKNENQLKIRFEEISLKNVDQDILKIIHATPALARCRTLDALHVATALFFKENSQEDFAFVSFDIAAKQLAKNVGLRNLA